MEIDRERAPLTARVTLGQRVLTSDQKELGIVGRTTSKQFEVNPADGSPYWLERQSVVSAEREEVVVGFPRRQLARRRVKSDDADVSDGTTLSEIDTEGAMSRDEKLDQRERMDRDLARQRARRGDSPDEDRSYGEPVEEELARLEDQADEAAGRRASGD